MGGEAEADGSKEGGGVAGVVGLLSTASNHRRVRIPNWPNPRSAHAHRSAHARCRTSSQTSPQTQRTMPYCRPYQTTHPLYER